MRHLAFALLLAVPLFSHAQETLPYFNVDSKGLWVEGYDPVAYSVQKKAIKGNAAISTVYKGATFRFAIAANRDLFLKDPERYLPMYGGWCAYALGANNEKVEVDPETFKIIDGKVFLFYNAYFNNTLTTWNKNEASLHRDADRNWAAFVHNK